jgi:hypothetical protein
MIESVLQPFLRRRTEGSNLACSGVKSISPVNSGTPGEKGLAYILVPQSSAALTFRRPRRARALWASIGTQRSADRRTRSEQSGEQSAEQLQEVDHPEAMIAHRGICASPDAIFGSHRWAKPNGYELAS